MRDPHVDVALIDQRRTVRIGHEDHGVMIRRGHVHQSEGPIPPVAPLAQARARGEPRKLKRPARVAAQRTGAVQVRPGGPRTAPTDPDGRALQQRAPVAIADDQGREHQREHERDDQARQDPEDLHADDHQDQAGEHQPGADEAELADARGHRLAPVAVRPDLRFSGFHLVPRLPIGSVTQLRPGPRSRAPLAAPDATWAPAAAAMPAGPAAAAAPPAAPPPAAAAPPPPAAEPADAAPALGAAPAA